MGKMGIGKKLAPVIVLCLAGSAYLTSASAENVIGNISGEVSISSGMSSYSLPIAAPSSIHSLNPGISVNYRQTAGPSILGVGFSISVSSAITRCIASKLQDGFNAGLELNQNTRFCHNGSKLVAISGENGAAGSEYRSFIDGNNKYESIGGSNFTPEEWVQRSPDGYIYRYQRQEQVNDLFASWLLVRKENQFGSGIDYQYSSDPIPVLTEISYPGYQIEFNYELRSHPLEQHRQGIKLISDKLLESVAVYSVTSGLAERMHTYRFNYDRFSGFHTGDHIVIDRLSSIDLCYGADGSTSCLAPVTYDYAEMPDSRVAYDNAADKTIVMPRSLYQSDAAIPEVGFTYRPAFTAGDLNADGLADFCYYKPNTGLVCSLHSGSGYGDPTTWSENLGYEASETDYEYFSQVQLLDLNRDGLADYCITDDLGVRCGVNSGNEKFDESSYWVRGDEEATGNLDLPIMDQSESPQFNRIDDDHLIDICGITSVDGVDRYQCYQNTGTEFYGNVLNLADDLNTTATFQAPVTYRASAGDGDNYSATMQVPDELEALINDEGNLDLKMSAPHWQDIDGDQDLDLCWLDLDGDFNCSFRSTDQTTKLAVYSPNTTLTNIDIPATPALVPPSSTNGGGSDTRSNSEASSYYSKIIEYSKSLETFRLSFRQADLNGDGLIDICYEKSTQYECLINNGNGFNSAAVWFDIESALNLTMPSGLSSDEKDSFKVKAKGIRSSIRLRDVNFDGLADLCAMADNFQRCGYNQGGHFADPVIKQSILSDIDANQSKSSGYHNFVQKIFGVKSYYRITVARASYGNYLTVGDVNLDGHPDNCYRGIDGVLCVTDDNFVPPGLLTGVTDSFGQETTITYGNLLGSGRYSAATSIPEGYIESRPNRLAVTSLTTDSGAIDRNSSESIQNKVEYYYQGSLVNPETGGGGFSAIEWRNPVRGTKSRSVYHQQQYLHGSEKLIEEYLDEVLVGVKVNSKRASEQEDGTVKLYVDATYETRNDLNGQLVSISETSNSDFDEYGFPQTVQATKTQGSEWLTTTTSSTYRNDASKWIIGRPDYQTVTHSDQDSRSVNRGVDYVYEGVYLKREIIQPGSALARTIEYEYDSNGNAEKVTTSGSGKSRALSKTFDERGRIKTASNELGQTESFTYHSRCGSVETHTDIGGRMTQTFFDTACRGHRVESADSNAVTREYLKASSQDNDWFYQPGVGDHKNLVKYKIKETSATGLWHTSFHDAQGRVIRKEAQGHSDEDIQRISVNHSIYDRYGRKTATNLPYFRDSHGNSPTPSWATITYDQAGRPKTQTKIGPTGSPLSSTYSYDRTTTTINYADYQKVSISGIHGKPTQITENGIGINYTYDPMGNLLPTAPGWVIDRS